MSKTENVSYLDSYTCVTWTPDRIVVPIGAHVLSFFSKKTGDQGLQERMYQKKRDQNGKLTNT
jgi:hypothetical protein